MQFIIKICLLIASVKFIESNDGSYIIEERLLQDYIRTNKEPDNFQNIVQAYYKDKSTCDICESLVDSAIALRKLGADKEIFSSFVKKMCVWFTDLGEAVCNGLTNVNADAMLYIVDHTENLTGERACAIKLQHKNCVNPHYQPWHIDLPPGTSPDEYSKHNRIGGKKKILHLTDVHYDPLYAPGHNVECDYYLCCGRNDGKPDDSKLGAGYWGEYHSCDTPWHSIQNLLDNVKEQHREIDWIYMTGDLVSHRSWETTKESNTESVRKIMKELKDTFGTIPVYPVLGNHESHPSDLYSTGNLTEANVSIQWVFDLMAEEWSRWLPEATKTTIRRGGFYSVLAMPGFRIIGLNSNVCFTGNLWLLHNDEDPYGQLQWLVDTLLQAEQNNEFVHILSHVPPGDFECFKRWNEEYNRIVVRFANTITGQFNGHTHYDELKIYFDKDDPQRVVNVAFNGGSITTFVGMNPNYRLYEVEEEKYRVFDYEQWTFNLSAANQNAAPDWFKLYSFKEAYGMNPAEIPDYLGVVQRMTDNFTYVEAYRRFQVRGSPLYEEECNHDCLIDIFCSITNVDYEDSHYCLNVKNKRK